MMSWSRGMSGCVRSLLLLACVPVFVSAQTQADGVAERLAKLEGAAASAQTAGDNAWMLVCAALVLMMTGPGLALFYGGLVRRKNVLATMMQSFILMAVVTVLWALFGYSLAFAEGTPFVGRSPLRLPERRRHGAERDLRGDHPAADLHDLPVDVRDHHARAHHGRVRRADEVQRDARLHCPLDDALSISRWRTWSGARAASSTRCSAASCPRSTSPAERSSTSRPASRRWCVRSCSVSRVGYGREPMTPHSLVLSLIGACTALGGLVWLQRWQRALGGKPCDQCVRRDALRGRGGDARLGRGRVGAHRQADRARGDLGRGGGAGRHHARLRVRHADVRACHRVHRGAGLLPCGDGAKEASGLRRLARCLRRPRRGRDARARS